MTEIKLQRLYTVAKGMDRAWGLHASESEADDVVPCRDHRVSVVEHACHEMGHALLLGLLPGPSLAYRIGLALSSKPIRRSSYAQHRRVGWGANETNEIQTFAITIAAMTLMGFECVVEVFAEACEVQVGGSKKDIIKAIRSFERTRRCLRLAKRIVREFQK